MPVSGEPGRAQRATRVRCTRGLGGTSLRRTPGYLADRSEQVRDDSDDQRPHGDIHAEAKKQSNDLGQPNPLHKDDEHVMANKEKPLLPNQPKRSD